MSTTKKQLEEQLKSLINSKAPKKLIDSVKEKLSQLGKDIKK